LRITVSDRLRRCALVAGALVAASCLHGCSDDPTDPGGGGGGGTGTAITVSSIIFNPKSPMPGDTMIVTADVHGSLNVGDFVTYAWSATGGTFLETDKSSVRWVTPDTTSGTLFDLTVQAANSVSNVSRTEAVLVNRLTTLVGSSAGEIHTTATGDLIYYLSSPFAPTQERFLGFEIRRNDAGGDVAANGGRFGFDYKFDQAVSQAVHVEDQFFFPDQRLKQIYHDDLTTGISVPLPTPPLGVRVPQLTEPDFSPDGQLITYQALLPDQNNPPAQGGVDTFEVFVFDIGTQQASRVTSTLLNFHSSFSSDGGRLVFMSDTTGGLRDWELYSLPVVAGVVTPDSVGPVTQLTSTGGAIGDGMPPSIGQRAWNNNPANPILAIVDSNDKLNLVRADGSGSLVVNVADNVTDFVWTNAGDRVAMTAGGNIYVVSTDASAQIIHTVADGDNIFQLSWSADGEFLVYNLVRLSDSWYELIDVTGSTGLPGPVRISAAVRPGNADSFGDLLETRPAWLPNAPTAFLLFFNARTPRLSTLGLSGLTP